MQTSFEVLFLLSMIVPPAAVVVGMAILFGALMGSGGGRARPAAVPRPEGMALGHPIGR
jgi:hypothetical protein